MKNEIQHVKDEFLQEEYTLIHHESGLTVYVFPKKLGTAYVSLSTAFGSLDNCFSLPNEETSVSLPDGVAHFLEHKMFESEDHIDTFDKFAAVGASANAFTSNEVTSYLFSTSGDIVKPLSILLDYVFHPYFTEENVKKEQGIIAQEIGMYDDSPFNRLYYAMMESLYVHHGIRRNICGSVESISTITPALLHTCFRAFYHPKNMTLIVCGRISVEEVLSLADKYIPLCAWELPERIYPEEPKEVLRKEFSFSMDVARPIVCLGIKDTDIKADPHEKAARSLCMNLLADLLFGSGTDFYDTLYRKRLISSDFSVSYESTNGCGHLLFSASTDDPSALLLALKEEIKLYKEGKKNIAPSDFLRIRRVHFAEFVKDFDSTEEIASALLDAMIDGVSIFETGKLLQKITQEDVEDVIKTFLNEDTMAEVVIYPEKGKEIC